MRVRPPTRPRGSCPSWETMKGLFTAPARAADAKAIAKPIFDGTLDRQGVHAGGIETRLPPDRSTGRPVQQFRAAVENSLEDLAISDVRRIAKALKPPVAPKVIISERWCSLTLSVSELEPLGRASIWRTALTGALACKRVRLCSDAGAKSRSHPHLPSLPGQKFRHFRHPQLAADAPRRWTRHDRRTRCLQNVG